MFSDGDPDRVAVESNAAGMIAKPVLHLDLLQQLSRRQVESRQITLLRGPIDRRDPQDTAFDVDSLDVMECGLERQDRLQSPLLKGFFSGRGDQE